jgi:hypothetical protein
MKLRGPTSIEPTGADSPLERQNIIESARAAYSFTGIAEAVLAMRTGEPATVIGGTSHLHPTLSEALMEAALDVDGETIHFLTKNRK